ncbi:MAG: SRPBCC family protein [Thermoleophilaceae bacterium]|nr:SRPBCC family protein [Thermoleophilaceae bacterium]
MQKSATQQTFIDAPLHEVWDLIGDPNRHPEWWPEVLDVECADLRQGCRYRGVVKGFLGAEEHDLLLTRLEDCREVSIYCGGTGVTTRFVLTEAQGGTFVEGYFGVEPESVGMKVFSAVAGRRFLRGWLERSLENLKSAAEAQRAAA